jgi:hypothetical protein
MRENQMNDERDPLPSALAPNPRTFGSLAATAAGAAWEGTMTMGRKKGLSAVHILVLVALVVVALICLFSYSTVARLALPFMHAPAAANRTPPTLPTLALTEAEISRALQTAEPLTLKSSRNSCDIPNSVDCAETTYASEAGDRLMLTLARFPSADAAINFGLAMKFEQEEQQHATAMDIPTTLENFRWLEAAPRAGTDVYYGGANEHSTAMFMTWEPTSVVVPQDEAVRAFSRLLDAQLAKIRSGS